MLDEESASEEKASAGTPEVPKADADSAKDVSSDSAGVSPDSADVSSDLAGEESTSVDSEVVPVDSDHPVPEPDSAVVGSESMHEPVDLGESDLEISADDQKQSPDSQDTLQDDLSTSESEPSSSPTMDVGHPLAQDIILNPDKWRIWPAVAVLRWLLKRATREARRIVYRSEPSLSFTPSEISDIAFDADGIELVLNAPGLAAPGSPLPLADVDRIMKDKRAGGALAAWLDGPGDRFMHALETSQARNNVAFAIATGGRIESLELASELTGRSTPLTATPGWNLTADRRKTPEGALGLASIYLGQVSAVGMENLFHAVTELPVTVKEFTGAEIPVARPSRLGWGIGAMLGRKCYRAEAGIEVILEGGSNVETLQWVRSRVRRNSLKLLADSYLGGPFPQPSIFLRVNADIIPPAALDGGTTLGKIAFLGQPQKPVFLPILVY